MKLTDEQIIKFQELYEKKFGEKISREQALEKGLRLMRLVELIFRPITKADFQNLQKRRQETETQ